jgi:hypothetical protein
VSVVAAAICPVFLGFVVATFLMLWSDFVPALVDQINPESLVESLTPTNELNSPHAGLLTEPRAADGRSPTRTAGSAAKLARSGVKDLC